MAYRRKSTKSGVSRATNESGPSIPEQQESGHFAKPTIIFNLGRLCSNCPPLRAIDEPGVQETGMISCHLAIGYRSQGDLFYKARFQTPTTGEGDEDGRNILSISYDAPTARTNDEAAIQAQEAAELCPGPRPNALGILACGAVSVGLKCDLYARDISSLPHPEYVPEPNERGTARLDPAWNT
jgi:hypothetical protein